ncbi:MAG TPA: reverse transcriptase domain-containing protein [Bacteroidia bacterium]|nr:reverse transcriptase domain-containing protein [Bacteroidia bacterium]
MNKDNTWLKSKGYLHFTNQINVFAKRDSIIKKVTDKEFIEKYAFYPLIHTILKERKYKKIDKFGKRAHSYINENGSPRRTIKNRPLHYATHMDAIIFGYYADLLQKEYENSLLEHAGLTDCIIAYRKIPTGIDGKNKSTIHFAKEVFDEIRRRTELETECVVLAFDIKNFFSTLDHDILKSAWSKLLNEEKLPKDHYNVFKGATRFSYILKDDLRQYCTVGRKRAGFDERELARIRNRLGINSFFESPKAFRDKLKSGQLKVYKRPFVNKETKKPIGIPQGLPISAVLANLYLLEFDTKVLKLLVKDVSCFYRRYSDDIVVVCSSHQKKVVEQFIIDSMKESKVIISEDKTETFYYTKDASLKGNAFITCFKETNNTKVPASFIYLGFQFDGKNVLIKSSNLAKFYRRMISSVKRKVKRSFSVASQNPDKKPVIFRRQLYKLYSELDLNKTKIHKRWKRLVKTEFGNYKLISGKRSQSLKSNYFGYANRASEIMEEPKIKNQVRNHRKIFNQAIYKHLTSKIKNL